MSFFSPSAPSPPPRRRRERPTAPPSVADPEIEEAKRKERLRAVLTRGRRATILTSGEGAPGEPLTDRRTLLGAVV